MGEPDDSRAVELSESDIHEDPIIQFQRWFEIAVRTGVPQPEAMTLATASTDCKPSARVVLLKGFDPHGFVFFTNYESRKGRDVDRNPWAAAVFFWPALARQIRIEGTVSRIAPSESDAYFVTRPKASQLAAWASAQSRTIVNRQVLEDRMETLARKYIDVVVPRPPYWGGYRLIPHTIEFWQGRPNRLHDRLRYTRHDGERWTAERLAP